MPAATPDPAVARWIRRELAAHPPRARSLVVTVWGDLLAPHGGDMNGFILIRGDAAKLGQVMATDEYLTLEQKASYLLDGHGVIGAVFGEGINRNMAIYQQVTSGG